VTFGRENFGIINFDTRRHLVVKRAISLYCYVQVEGMVLPQNA
jgi:hypothetical protein